MPCCPTRSSKSNPAARSTAITMFESLTDEGYIPCVSLLDFQKTGGKLDMTAYGRALDFGYKTYVLTTLYTSKTNANCKASPFPLCAFNLTLTLLLDKESDAR